MWFYVQHLCVVFVFSMTLVHGFLSPSCNFVFFFLPMLYLDYVSLLCIFHVGMRNRL